MKKVGLIYDEVFLKHVPPDGHPESPERLRSMMSALKKTEIFPLLIHKKPRRAALEDIVSVHSQDYLEKIQRFKTGYFDPDTYISEGTVDAARCAAGAVLEAIDGCRSSIMERAFCPVRPPGHHAERDRAMGFCIFNNVAIGARYAQNVGFRKVFIVDFDVHHGNGTEHIFYDDNSVFYFSTHQYPHYPGTGSQTERGSGRGQGATYNIPMPYGSGDGEYIHAYEDVLHGLVSSFDPDIMLVSAGYDIHERDPLAGIHVSDRGIKRIVRGILTAKYDIPCIFSLEGGYDQHALARSVVITLEAMLEIHD